MTKIEILDMLLQVQDGTIMLEDLIVALRKYMSERPKCVAECKFFPCNFIRDQERPYVEHGCAKPSKREVMESAGNEESNSGTAINLRGY